MAGLRVGQAFGVLLLPGFGVGSSSPQVLEHPTSMCDAGVKKGLGVKGHCHAIWQLYKNLEDVFASIEFQN